MSFIFRYFYDKPIWLVITPETRNITQTVFT